MDRQRGRPSGLGRQRGFAFTGWEVSVSDVVPGNMGSGSDRHFHHGLTVGAGLEWGLTANWIVGVEYDYYRFSRETYQLARGAAGVYNFNFAPRDITRSWAASAISSKCGASVVTPLVAKSMA